MMENGISSTIDDVRSCIETLPFVPVIGSPDANAISFTLGLESF